MISRCHASWAIRPIRGLPRRSLDGQALTEATRYRPRMRVGRQDWPQGCVTHSATPRWPRQTDPAPTAGATFEPTART